MEPAVTLSATERKNYKLAYGLAIFTIVYNLVEGIIATVLGYQDETLALFGFGLDSFIEMISGFGIAYMIVRIRQNPGSTRSQFEKTALRITGVSFYLLVAGLGITGIINIVQAHAPQTTFWGVIISVVSILVMLLLYFGKMKAGRALKSAAIIADAGCTKICIYMSCALLASSAIYAVTGFIYADALGALVLAWFSFREGRECFQKSSGQLEHCEHC